MVRLLVATGPPLIQVVAAVLVADEQVELPVALERGKRQDLEGVVGVSYVRGHE